MRRGSIRLPPEMDRDAMRQAGQDDTDGKTMNAMQKSKSRVDGNMTRLSMMLQRTSDIDEDAFGNDGKPAVVRRKGSSLRKHPSVPEFTQLNIGAGGNRAASKGSAQTQGTSASYKSRRSSFNDEVSQEQAKRFRDSVSNQNQAGELSRWLNAEMISRREAEGSKDRLTLRQLMKVDDRINTMDFHGKKYDKSDTIEEEEEDDSPKLMPNARTRLRHTVSYRHRTLE